MDKRPLRVAVLARSVYSLHGYGGLERHVDDLVRHLLARDVAVTLITRPRRDPAPHAEPLEGGRHEQLSILSVPYRTFPFAGRRGTTVIDRSTAYPWFGIRAGRLAASLVRNQEVDLVHGLGASALGYARARARRPDCTVPFVFNPQGLEEFGATNPKRARLKLIGYRPLQIAVRACARAADRIIASDRVLVSSLLDHLSISPDRVRVVPNAVDLARCDRLTDPGAWHRLRSQLGLGPDDSLLLSVGRIEANKGFHVAVRALARLSRQAGHVGSGPGGLGGNWRWVLLGDGPFRPTLERSLKRHGLRDRVVLPGRVTDAELHAWYEAATLFVHPTLYEGSSLVTLEAMAHRRPVVATTAGGLPDKVKPGISGWLVPPGDFEGLAAALQEALTQRDRLAEVGAEGRAIVEREFSWAAATGKLLEIYDEVLFERG